MGVSTLKVNTRSIRQGGDDARPLLDLRDERRSGGLLAIVNPAAGGGRCGRRARQILPRLRELGIELEVRETSGRGDATGIAAEEWRAGRRCFVAVGGDGTAFEVLNGLLPQARPGQEPPTMGILPLGTGNSFVRDFAENGEDYSIEAIRRDVPRPCDVLHVRHAAGELFALGTVSLAFAADVAALANRRLKRLGRLGYTLGVLLRLAALAPLRLVLDVDREGERELDTVLLCVQNNRHVGGNMLMAPRAEIDDGRADLVVAAPVSRLELLRTFPRIFRGTHVHHPAVSTRPFETVALRGAPELDTMVDGESLRLRIFGIEVVPGAIRILL
jgi:YegS/Rv2252/BmrU family lipid kinase